MARFEKSSGNHPSFARIIRFWPTGPGSWNHPTIIRTAQNHPTDNGKRHDPRKKLIEVRCAGFHQQGCERREICSKAWAPANAALLVGATAAGGGAGVIFA